MTSEGVGDLVTGSGSYVLNLSQFEGLGGNQQLPGYIRDSFVHTDWVVLEGVGYLKSQFIELYSHEKLTKVVFDAHNVSRQNPLTSAYPSTLTQDPTANLDLFGDVGDDNVETIGTKNIGGVSAVHCLKGDPIAAPTASRYARRSRPISLTMVPTYTSPHPLPAMSETSAPSPIRPTSKRCLLTFATTRTTKHRSSLRQ